MKKLINSILTFSGMTIISRCTGLIREMVFAYYFGATWGMDAFYLAYRIPNFLRNLFGEGAFSQAFIPVLAEYRQTQSQAATQQFLNRIAGMLLVCLLLITGTVILFAPGVVYLLAPGFVHDPQRFQLTVTLLRITFPFLIFISGAAFASGILNTEGRFGISSFSPNLLNVTLIVAAIWGSRYIAPIALKFAALGVTLGGAAQLLCQLPLLRRLQLIPCPQFVWQDIGVRRVLKLMLPAIFGVSIAQLSFLINNLLASFLPRGSVSWLNYSNLLAMFPLGIFGVAISTVILPYLAALKSETFTPKFSQTIDWSLRLVLLIALPAAIGLYFLAGPIVTTLFKFQAGRFTTNDILMVCQSLQGFAVGIPAFMLIKVSASVFYAQQKIAIPVKIAAVSLGINILAALLLILPLKHAGLALATTISSTCNALGLLYGLKWFHWYEPKKGWGRFLTKLILANAALGITLFFAVPGLPTWLTWSSWLRFSRLFLICIGSTIGYFTLLWLLRFDLVKLLLPDHE